MADLDKLEEVVKEVKKLAVDFKKRNGNAFIKIPNKDFNLWLINKLTEQDGKIKVLEAKQKMLIWIIGISVPAIGFVCGLIKVSV